MPEITRLVDTSILIDFLRGSKTAETWLDCLIAASAYHYGITVCTLNEKHFRPFPKLQVQRPY